MPTSAERNALLFLAAVAVIGAGARYAGARRFAAEVAAGESRPAGNGDTAALAAQLAGIDSAQAVRPSRPARAGGAGRRRRTDADTRRRSPSRPRANPDSRENPEQPTLSGGERRRSLEPIDINRATAEELEQLPLVGPALAKRIVAWRDQHGAFDSEESLRHVRGIGVTTAARIAPLVTFSTRYRPYRSEVRPSGRDGNPPMS